MIPGSGAEALRTAIERVLRDTPSKDLVEASRALTGRYRAGSAQDLRIRSEVEARAYVAARLPATFAALTQILSEARRLEHDLDPTSHLDLGAGTGAAAWAAASVWPGLARVTLIDRDERMMTLGEMLQGAAPLSPEGRWTWRREDLATSLFEPHALVTLSYVLGELDLESRALLAKRAWEATLGLLVVVEPGTPSGFSVIRDIRTALVGEGANLLAPCPHDDACPMSGTDWCHFAARVDRSALHRRVKEARLSHEDEKFSYLVFTRSSAERVRARVIRHPMNAARRVELLACTDQGLEKLSIVKSNPNYKIGKKLRWGSAIPPEILGP